MNPAAFFEKNKFRCFFKKKFTKIVLQFRKSGIPNWCNHEKDNIQKFNDTVPDWEYVVE